MSDQSKIVPAPDTTKDEKIKELTGDFDEMEIAYADLTRAYVELGQGLAEITDISARLGGDACHAAIMKIRIICQVRTANADIFYTRALERRTLKTHLFCMSCGNLVLKDSAPVCCMNPMLERLG